MTEAEENFAMIKAMADAGDARARSFVDFVAGFTWWPQYLGVDMEALCGRGKGAK